MHKQRVTWERMFDNCAKVATALVKDSLTFTDVVGIARGGLVPAQFFAYQFDIKRIYSIGINYYLDDKKQKQPIIYQPLTEEFVDRSVLVVDEIADSGDTFLLVKKELQNRGCKNITTASVFYKPCSKFKPDYIGETVSPDKWIVLPWDTEER